MKIEEEKKILEAVLLCAQRPLSLRDLVSLFASTDNFNDENSADLPMTDQRCDQLLHDLQSEWANKGLELVHLSDGWRFQSRSEMKPYFDRLSQDKPIRYSRATMEILAIIAYSQPVTRGDIEQIRGVAVNPSIIRTLQDRGWIEVIGRRDVPGRPELFATTLQFLNDLGLRSLEQLPQLQILHEMDLLQSDLS